MSSQSAAKKDDMATGIAKPSIVEGKKDLYELGEIPPLGHVPKNMYAWTIREERHGDDRERDQSFDEREAARGVNFHLTSVRLPRASRASVASRTSRAGWTRRPKQGIKPVA